MNSFGEFENIYFESIAACESVDSNSGLHTRIYFAPTTFFDAINLPESNEYVGNITISSENIQMSPGKNWFYADCLIEENELKTISQGNALRKKNKSQLDIYIVGFAAKTLGLVSRILNVPLVIAVRDANDQIWIIGNLKNPAIITKLDATTGKSYADNAGVSLTFSSNSPAFNYIGDISITINEPTIFYTREAGLASYSEEEISVSQSQIYYAPISYFDQMSIPNEINSSEDLILEQDDILMNSDKGWFYMDCLMDETTVSSATNGGGQNSKLKTQLDFYLPGFEPKIVGFLEKVIDVPMVFAFIDKRGQTWIIGNTRNAAQIIKSESTTAKQYDNMSGVSVGVSANSPVFMFAGNMDQFNIKPGEFNADFNIEFRI